MKKKKTQGIDPGSISEFRSYQSCMREEAKSFLENKGEFLSCNYFSTDYKLIRLSELVDFFILEEIPEVADELSAMGEALRVKKMLNSDWVFSR
jgi:hypothetical protein